MNRRAKIDYAQKYEDWLNEDLDALTVEETIAFNLLNDLEERKQFDTALELMEWNDFGCLIKDWVGLIGRIFEQVRDCQDDEAGDDLLDD